MLELKKIVWQQAVNITSSFEGPGIYSNVTGNFDGQYLSYGFIQFNFGTGTLQPLFRRLFREFPQVAKNTLPNGGVDLLNALNKGVEKTWALSIQKNNKVLDPWFTALKNLGQTPECQKIQDDAANWYREGAIKLCQQFDLTTDRAYCLFFDIMVQNGGVKFYQITETKYLDKLASIAKVVANRSNPQWQNDVLSRKMAIVNGSGRVHGVDRVFQFNDNNAIINLDDQTVDSINDLVNKKIINSPQYWIENVSKGDLVEGEFVGSLINRIASSIKQSNITGLSASIKVLIDNGIVKTPDYWLINATKGKKINGEFLAIIIKKASPLTQVLMDFELLDAIKILLSKNIISKIDYWQNNSQPNHIIKGEYAETLIKRVAGIISQNTSIDLQSSLQLFLDKGIIKDKTYWAANVVIGGQIKGEYIATLIKRMVKFI